MRTLTLFAGVGCSMLAGRVLGHEHVAAVERDPFRCAVLRARASEGWFPGLAVHEGDVRAFNARPYAGRVDLVCAGWPCQDLSRIGTRAGLDGQRSGLWSEVRRTIGEVRPRRVFLENGPDIVSHGLERVLADLAELGMDARWGIVAAKHACAAHMRDRWWCMADAVCDGLAREPRGGQRRGQLAHSVAEWMISQRCRADGTSMAGDERLPTVLPNPDFSETLMRLPGGWSRLASLPSETDRTCSPPASLGTCSGVADD